MPEDASLDDFLPADEEPTDGEASPDSEREADERASADADEADPDDAGGSTDPSQDADDTADPSQDADDTADPSQDADDSTDPSQDATAPDAVEPARSTYAWSPDGADCAACGAVVERRWRDGDELVCSECKEW